MQQITSIAFAREASIYAKELHQYRRDSNHAAEQRKAYRLRTIRASSRYLLSRIFDRTTLPNSAVSALLAFSLFGLLHPMYA